MCLPCSSPAHIPAACCPQLHRTSHSTFQFLSRRGHDHGEKSSYGILYDALKKLVIPERVVLDGELVVWNKTR